MTRRGHVVGARRRAEVGARRVGRVVVALHVQRVLGHDREPLRPVAREPKRAAGVAAVDDLERAAEEHRRIDPRFVHRDRRRERGRSALRPGAGRAGRGHPRRIARQAVCGADRRVQPRHAAVHVQHTVAVDVLARVEHAVGHALRGGGVDDVLEPQFTGLAIVGSEVVRGVENAVRAGARRRRIVGAEVLVAAAVGEVDHEAGHVHRVGVGRQPEPQVVHVELDVVHHAAEQRHRARAGGVVAPGTLARVVERERQVVGLERGPRTHGAGIAAWPQAFAP